MESETQPTQPTQPKIEIHTMSSQIHTPPAENISTHLFCLCCLCMGGKKMLWYLKHNQHNQKVEIHTIRARPTQPPAENSSTDPVRPVLPAYGRENIEYGIYNTTNTTKK